MFSEYDQQEFYKRNSVYECDNCGYQWKVESDSIADITEEDEDINLHGLSEKFEPKYCPMCGSRYLSVIF
ncbi:MAG: hypothetical protein AB1765_09900 [Candidatus Hydrogenedentota bacterium]